MTRRRLLLIYFCGLGRAWGASDFWNRKSPGDWTEQEILALITKSPWAQEAPADPKVGGSGPVPETAGSNGGRDKPVIGAGAATMSVCWDSAQPVLDALGNILP